ncbi:MAG TPA: chain length determinant protein EpsF [Burkholderiales bacterium]|nr:chain length determinant protein EpsF [Burkholderiales bacterium]
MDLSQFILALRARRKAFLMVFGATVIAALAIALIMPRTYVGTTQVMVDARDEQSMAAGVRNMSARERQGYMQTQLDLIQSTRVAKRVIRETKYLQQPEVREDYERATGGRGTIEDWAAETLLKKLKADASASNIITISFAADHPQRAADIANGFAKAYVDTSLELRTEPSREAAAWFEDQLKGLRSNVSQAQSKLTAYQKEKGIFATEERGDIETTRLAEISNQLLQARNATYDAQTRHKYATEFISGNASAGAGAVDTLPEVINSAAVQALKAQLATAEARLEQASESLGPNHPQYQTVKAEVSALQSRLSSEMKRVVAGLSNAALQARKREEELRAAYRQQQERLVSMRDARVELAVMTRDVENAQRTYDAALTRWLTNKVEARAQGTNLAVLSPAVAPIEPKSPKVGLVSGLSVLVGGLLAAGVVFLLETLDRRVRSRGDLESRLAVPTLGRLSKWQPSGARLLPASLSGPRASRALPHPW